MPRYLDPTLAGAAGQADRVDLEAQVVRAGLVDRAAAGHRQNR